ncbi:AAA family ATPase [Nonomuraea sp. NPDC049141]|uniref:nSTAND1 domain-containing NTPase n=1 Tax=Nonomuraea sp. NPDC049141 TaxID=3155500 RepID=UPI0033CB20CE
MHGGYVLAAAARNELAMAPPGDVHTAFTGEMIRLINEGDPEGPQQLTLRHVYRYLDRALPAKGFPRPRHHASAWIDDFVLCPNPAYQPPVLSGPMSSKPAWTTNGGIPPVCPYPGLTAFGPNQAQWFFGRDRLISELAETLTERMDRTGPLVVVGPSGAGKSSLLGAGLLPMLAKGAVRSPGSRTWPHILFTPTEHPLTELMACMRQSSDNPQLPSANQLVDNPNQLAATIREILRDRGRQETISGARMVVVVDQFEEIFTQCADKNERQAFVRALCAISSGDGGDEPPALVVLGLRADFYGHCTTYPELRPALQEAPVIVGPMNTSEVHDAITRPAQVTGQALQPGLVEVLLRDLGLGDEAEQNRSPGVLPLLAHALRATWEHREDNTLTVSGYQATGGIKGAIATTAEAAYNQLDSAGQQAVRLLMLRMVQVGEGGADTRRRIDRSLIYRLSSPETAVAALEALVSARLVTLDEETAEITHEALLHAWPRLHRWIDADRVGLRIHQQLSEAANTWDRANREAAHLYQGSRLDLARDWASDPAHQADLSPLERTFLNACDRAAQRRTRRQRQIIAILATFLVLTLTASLVAVRQSQAAQTQERIAIARQLTAESATLAAGGQPEASMLHAVEAFQQDPTLIETRSTILSSQSRYFRVRLVGHKDTVYGVALSPNGYTLATASADRTVKLWDVSHHKVTATLAGHTSDVNWVVFSPDGHTLASASADGTVKLWSMANYKEIATLSGHTDQVTGVAFSPDGRMVASVGGDRTVRLWSSTKHKEIAVLTGHTGLIFGVGFSPNGQILATASLDTTVRLWSVARRKEIATLPAHTDDVNGVAFSPDGRTLATASNDRTVRLWNVARHKVVAVLTGHRGPVCGVAFSPDGTILATTSTDGTTKLWDVARREVTTTLAGHTGAVWAATFSRDGNTIATVSNDKSAVLWSMNGTILTPRPIGPVKRVTISPDGRTFVTSSSDRTVRIWSMDRNRVIATLTGHKDTVFGVAISPDGKLVATSSNDGTARLWDLARHHLIAALPHADTRNTDFLGLGVAFSPDGRTLATASNDGIARLWSVAHHKIITSLADHSGTVWGVAFSPDGGTLATTSSDKTVKLWDTHTHKLIATLTGHSSLVYNVAFSPDGHTLGTVSDDKTVKLWDTHTHKLIATLTGHSDGIWGLAFSPDGRTLATASVDKTVKLWDTHTHRLIATLTGHEGPVYGVAYSTDGHMLITASNDGTIRLWDTDPARVVAKDCDVIGPISRSQWAQLLPELPYHPTCPPITQ